MIKCNKCGFDNSEESMFCGNCGNNLKEQNIITNEPINVVNEVKVKKPFNKKIIFIGAPILLAIIVLITVLVIKGANNSFKDPFNDVDGFKSIGNASSSYEQVDFESTKTLIKEDVLEDDLNSGKITPSEYVLQYAYRVYGDKKISSKYKITNNAITTMSKLDELFEKYYDQLDDDTLAYIMEKKFLINYQLDDGSAKQQSSIDNNYNVSQLSNTFDGFDATIYTLNKVRLSSKGHFLIYYGTYGTNAITDSQALSIDNTLENTVSRYKELFNVDFKYKPIINLSATQETTKAARLLTANGISLEYLSKAMPVYVINTGETAQGYYVHADDFLESNLYSAFTRTSLVLCNNVTRFGAVGSYFCQGVKKIDPTQTDNADAIKTFFGMATTYSLPYFAVNSNITNYDNFDLVAQHELFHHYQRYICGDGEYKNCPTGLFTSETTANLASVLVKSIGSETSFSNFHAAQLYLNDVEKSIDKVGESYDREIAPGYGAFIYAYNYATIVPKGLTKMKNSIKYTDPLSYLYGAAEGKYKDVMSTLAEKNLTHDYDNVPLLPLKDGKLVNPPAHFSLKKDATDVSSTENINKSSIQYFYIKNASSFKNRQQISFNTSSEGLELLLLGSIDGEYTLLHKQDLNGEFVMNIAEFNEYDNLAIAIVDYTIADGHTYSYEYQVEGTKTPTIKGKEINKKGINISGLSKASAIYCYKREGTSVSQLTEIMVNYKSGNKIKDAYIKDTFKIEIDESSAGYSLAKTLMDTMIKGVEQLFNMYFSDCKMKVVEKNNVYTITIKIDKSYFDKFDDMYNLPGNTKIDVYNGFKNDGYTCRYK